MKIEKNHNTVSRNYREQETDTIPLEKYLSHDKLLLFATVDLSITKEKEKEKKNSFKSCLSHLLS